MLKILLIIFFSTSQKLPISYIFLFSYHYVLFPELMFQVHINIYIEKQELGLYQFCGEYINFTNLVIQEKWLMKVTLTFS